VRKTDTLEFSTRLTELEVVSPSRINRLPASRLEAQSISARAVALSGTQDGQRTKDAVATTAAVVVLWPAAFQVGGDKQTATELAQMKGVRR
jgi:hypothetical protein